MNMTNASNKTVAVVIPNWNGKDDLPACLDSLQRQTLSAEIIVVENGSTDGSAELVAGLYPQVTVLPQEKNLGFAGGVNVGIRYALAHKLDYVALFNNDAVADKDWLKQLVATLDANPKVGIATCKFMNIDKKHLDSTGDIYTHWGLSYPRGRGEEVGEKYDSATVVFGASGGASLYRCSMLEQIDLFDEDFFAYYEDVDISFRAQLAGWSVVYNPRSIAYHRIGTTSGKLRGFATYQTIKNTPWIVIKNVPAALLPIVLPRLVLAQTLFVVRAILRGHGWHALKGVVVGTVKLPKKLKERFVIQKSKKVSNYYVRSILMWDLPPTAHNLRKLRQKWWSLRNKNNQSTN